MGNAAGVVAAEDQPTSEVVRTIKEDVQRQMKELKIEGKLGSTLSTKPEVVTSHGKFSASEGADQTSDAEAKQNDGGGVEKGERVDAIADDSDDGPASQELVTIKVPRNLAKLLETIQGRVQGLEKTIEDMHTAQMLGDEAIECILDAHPVPGQQGVPYFVYDALDVPVDDDPFPALSHRPIQVLRVRNFIMQEDRTARLITALKSPFSKELCELHFLNCEWEFVQASDVAATIVESEIQIAVLNLSRSQKLRAESFVGFKVALSHLRTLNLEYCQHIDDSCLEMVASQCRGLRVLNLNGCFKVTDKSVQALLKTNQQLHDARFNQSSISDSALEALANTRHNLRRLHVAGCKGITNKGLEAISKQCAKLIDLDVSRCDKVSTAGLVAIATGCTSILHVRMAELYLVKDEAVKALSEHCHELMTLDVSKCSLLKDDGLKALARGCPFLRELQINECRQISIAAVGALSEGCEFLRHFSLRKCGRLTDEAVTCFGDTSQNLEVLDLNGCEKISDAGIEALVRGCSKLRSIDCTACYVSDEALKSIGYHCPKLESIRISNTQYVTDWGMSYLSDGFRRCSFLKTVDFSSCPQITDKGLTSLCQGVGAHIEVLNLTGCTGLTNNGMFAVAKHMAHLKNLRIGAIPSLTSNALLQLSKGCLFLEELFLEDCTGITKLVPILQFSASLRTVMVCGVSGAIDLDVLIAACSGESENTRRGLQVVHWRESKGVVRLKMI